MKLDRVLADVRITRNFDEATPNTRIMFLAGSLVLGGAERQLIHLANALVARGIRVTIVAVRSRGFIEASRLMSPEIEAICLDRRHRLDIRFVGRLVKILRRQNPDVLHSYLVSANILASVMKRLWPGKVVWGIRSARKYTQALPLLERFGLVVLTLLRNTPDLVICNSDAGRRALIEQGIPASLVTVIPNGIDTSRFRPDSSARKKIRADLGAREDEVLIGIVASLRPVKDHPTLLEAYKRIRESFPASRLVIVGTGPSEWSAYLKNRAEELGLEEHVSWLGARDDVHDIFNGLDVVASSSLIEGFSSVIAEALATGTPCVVTDVGDSALIVDDPGFVVPPRDPEALSASIVGAIDRIKASKWDGQKARERIIARYSTGALVRNTEAALISIIDPN